MIGFLFLCMYALAFIRVEIPSDLLEMRGFISQLGGFTGATASFRASRDPGKLELD